MRHLFIMGTPAIGLTLAMLPDVPLIVAAPALALGLVVFGKVYGEE